MWASVPSELRGFGGHNSVATHEPAARHRDAQPDSTSLAFKALVDLKSQDLQVDSRNFALAAGMQVSAEIVQGKRTVLKYLLSPV